MAELQADFEILPRSTIEAEIELPHRSEMEATFEINVTEKGDTGNGIESIEKTSTQGLVDTYTIQYTDGNSTTFDVTNGETLTLNATDGLSLNQVEDVATISGKALQDGISDINDLIPNQATPQNQLADKSFVNSSIATNTANFIGTFDSVEELEAYSGTLTNNDYAFVVGADSVGNTVYDRYKYTTATTPASWQFEYELNNSSFTADQWAAINSKATESKINQIETNKTAIGTLSSLTTVDKSNLVSAINELDSGKQPAGNYVTTNTAQTITGKKTFTDTVTASYGIEFDNNGNSFIGPGRNYIEIVGSNEGGTNGSSIILGEDGILLESDSLVCSQTPSTDTTSSTEVDTVGARNTKLQNYLNKKPDGTNDLIVNNKVSDNYLPVSDVTVNGTSVLNNGVAEIPEIPSASNFWTVGTQGVSNHQTTYSKKTIFYNAVGAQDSGFKMLASSDTAPASSTGAWSGRCLIGNEKRTFLLGTARNSASGSQSICGIGAHTWGSASSQTGAGWDNIYIQPDGSTAVYLGGNGWRGNSGWFRVQNSGSSSASYKAQINTGTSTSPAWKNILPNQSTGSSAILFTTTIASSNTHAYSTSVNGTASGTYSSSFGYGSNAANYATALGYNAKAVSANSIQIGQGTNNTANTMYVGLSSSLNVQLLDATGKIPDDRINTTIARTSDIKDSTITITQGGVTRGSFTLNQGTGSTIDIDASGSTPNDGTLTIQKNGTDVATFTANQSTNATANITVPTDTNELTNGAGYITGISSGDVTTALGYTPYDSSNPSGYTSNVGTVTSVNNTNPDNNGNVTISIPTVNNATLTIQKNGTDVATFTANSSTNKTANIIVPTSAADVGALPSNTTINDLTTTAQQDALNSGIDSTKVSQIATNTSDISDIDSLIPSQATTSNQLADKDFVNSSVSTNTAYFIGTFNSVAELEAYSGTLTNNDYAFVISTDADGNTVYNRYKYTTATTPASWVFEYALNNSSFTAAQWSAINSGATSTNISQITTNKNSIGTLTNLTTTAKTNLVSAINELDSNKAEDSCVVHTTGAETVGGQKTFTSTPIIQSTNPNIFIQDSDYSKGTAPSSTSYQWFGTLVDKNGKSQSNKMAQIYHTTYNGGNTDLHIQLFKPESGSTTIATDLTLKSNGTFEIPTPTDDTTASTQADTVGARNTKLAGYQTKATYDSVNEMLVLG